MTVSILSLTARADDEIAVTFEVRSGEYIQKETFLISTALVVDIGLQTGECDTDTYDAVSRGAEIYAATKRGLYMLGYGRTSERALCRKLMGKGYTREIALEAVRILSERGFLDDRTDAIREAERCVAKLWGKRRIVATLYSKGFSDTSVRGAIDDLEDRGVDFVEICAERLRKNAKISDLEPNERRKVIASLERCGFSGSEIRDAWQLVAEERAERA